MSTDTGQRWEKGNLCGVCPYRKAVQAENDRLREALLKISYGASASVFSPALIAREALSPLPEQEDR